MVTVSPSSVADTLHLADASELPEGADADITAAEAIVGDQVEPYTDSSDLVEQCAIHVAAAFITGTEGDAPIQQLQRESGSIRFDTTATASEARDYWTRAQALDPTGRLGDDTASFGTY